MADLNYPKRILERELASLKKFWHYSSSIHLGLEKGKAPQKEVDLFLKAIEHRMIELELCLKLINEFNLDGNKRDIMKIFFWRTFDGTSYTDGAISLKDILKMEDAKCDDGETLHEWATYAEFGDEWRNDSD